MKIRLKEVSSEGKWYKHSNSEEMQPGEDFEAGQCYLKIRTFPLSKSNLTIRANEGLVLEGSERLKKFLYCWEDAKGLVDDNEQPIEIKGTKGEEIKKTIFDHNLGGIPGVVLGILDKLTIARAEAEKNS